MSSKKSLKRGEIKLIKTKKSMWNLQDLVSYLKIVIKFRLDEIQESIKLVEVVER